MPEAHARATRAAVTDAGALPPSRPFAPRSVAPSASITTDHSFGRVAVDPPGAEGPPPLQALEALQAKLDRQRSERSAQALQPPGQGKPLPSAIQAKMEHALGHDFSDVRVHEGPQAESVGALAYTRGTNLHFAPGRYSPTSHEGQVMLAHELTHVKQQKAGRVAVPGGTGAPVNADPALEAEADAKGREAARAPSKAGHSAGCGCPACSGGGGRSGDGGGGKALAQDSSEGKASGGADQAVQRCQACGDPGCTAGEVCGITNPHGSFLHPTQPSYSPPSSPFSSTPSFSPPSPSPPTSPYSSPGGTVYAQSPGGTEYRQLSPSGSYAEKPRRYAAGYINPSHSHGNMLPHWEKSAQSPIPDEVSGNERKLRKHLMDPSRHFEATSPGRSRTTTIQGHGQGVLGHEPSASTAWNTGGHQQTRSDNREHNRQTDTYHGIEYRPWSDASGSSEEPYMSPAPHLGSHPSYWNRNDPSFKGGPWHSWEEKK